MVPTEWRRPSQSEHLLQQSCWQGPLTVRRKLAVFFEADSENPAYLGQLLLQAGDVERNPGPVACGVCSRKVTSNSIKCTWCGNWIHQRCSGLEKKDITKLAKAETYAFECHKCAVAPVSTLNGSCRKYCRGVTPASTPRRSFLQQMGLNEGILHQLPGPTSTRSLFWVRRGDQPPVLTPYRNPGRQNSSTERIYLVAASTLSRSYVRLTVWDVLAVRTPRSTLT